MVSKIYIKNIFEVPLAHRGTAQRLGPVRTARPGRRGARRVRPGRRRPGERTSPPPPRRRGATRGLGATSTSCCPKARPANASAETRVGRSVLRHYVLLTVLLMPNLVRESFENFSRGDMKSFRAAYRATCLSQCAAHADGRARWNSPA